MEITLKGYNDEKVVIPRENLIEKDWVGIEGKPKYIEMSATVEDETILAGMEICDEKKSSYLSVDLLSRNEKFGTDALWCSLEAPNSINSFVTGYMYAGNNETESDDWLVRMVDSYRTQEDDSRRVIFVDNDIASVQNSRKEFASKKNKYKWFAASEDQFNQPFNFVDFGTRLETTTHGYLKLKEGMIISKDASAVSRVADMLDTMGFDDAVTGYFDPVEDKRNDTVGPLTGYYYVAI